MPPKRKRNNILPSSASRTDNGDASPTRYLMKIDSFSALSECGINKYESQFVFSGYKWNMIVYPNGDGDGDGCDHISVCLTIVGTSSLPPDWEVNATVSFLILDQIHDNYVVMRGMEQRFRSIKTEWAISKFISHATFNEPSNGYLVNDKCIFGVDVYVIKNQLLGECVSSLDVIHGQPSKHEWKISKFTKLHHVVCSEEFTVGGYKWKIWFFPTGAPDQKGKNISIYLNLVDAIGFDCQKRVLAKYHFSFKDQISGEHCRMRSSGRHKWFAAATDISSLRAAISLSEFKDPKKGFLVDDCCIVGVEISVLCVVNGFNSHILVD